MVQEELTESQKGLNTLLLFTRELIAVMPLIELVKQLNKIPTNKLKSFFEDTEKRKILETYFNKCIEVDKMLEPIDIQVFGKPMGLMQFFKGEDK